MPDLVALAAVTFIFGGGTISYFVKSMVRIAEIKAEAKQNKVEGNSLQLSQVLSELREEVAALRDTSTRFDMSFDAALTRLEGRVDRIEERNITDASSTVGAPTWPTVVSSAAPEPQVVLSRGGTESR